MGKIKNFVHHNIRKISGGKDPVNVLTEFIGSIGFDPQATLRDSSADHRRWMLALDKDKELEILLEDIKHSHETTIYLGINLSVVPIKGALDMLVVALELADGLIDAKISLVGHYLVISSGFPASDLNLEEIEYQYKMLTSQHEWLIKKLDEGLKGD